MYKYLAIASLTLIPQAAFAAKTFKSFVGDIIGVLNKVIVMLVAIALLAFIIALAKFMYQKGGSGELSNLKHNIYAGILGLFVIVCLWGIINFVGHTFNIL